MCLNFDPPHDGYLEWHLPRIRGCEKWTARPRLGKQLRLFLRIVEGLSNRCTKPIAATTLPALAWGEKETRSPWPAVAGQGTHTCEPNSPRLSTLGACSLFCPHMCGTRWGWRMGLLLSYSLSASLSSFARSAESRFDRQSRLWFVRRMGGWDCTNTSGR